MRRRPNVQVFLKPSIAVAGDEVLVEAELTSGAATPVDAINMTLRGEERVAYGEQRHVRNVVAQRAAFAGRTLEKGKHRVAARFPIPPDAPPSYAGVLMAVEYILELHVAIPWWLDRRERFVIPVTRRVASTESAPPRVYCNTTKPGNELYIETTVDDQRIEQDGVISGAVSFANVARTRIKRVELQYRVREHIGPSPDKTVWHHDAATYVSVILDRAPKEGETARFRVSLPKAAATTFRAMYGRVEWSVAVVAIVSFGDDIRIEFPIEVLPAGKGRKRRRAELPPVGRERRALLLEAASKQLDLELDVRGEELRTVIGPARVVIRLEPHESKGLVAVAELAWPALELELSLRERRWTDAFGEELALDDAAFRKRFHVTAKDSERATLMFDAEVRGALVGLTEAEIDDEGATLARPISVQSVGSLVEDLRPMLDATRSVADAAARIAPTLGYR